MLGELYLDQDARIGREARRVDREAQADAARQRAPREPARPAR
jgi:hypothetical protein